MGPIRVHEFVTLDGVIDTPTWTVDYGFDPAMGEAIAGIMSGCAGILLGRSTYQMFEPAWAPRTEDEDPGAPFMNETQKYVVSGSLTSTSWRNSEVLGPYSAGAISDLRGKVDGALYVSGSGTLVRALLQDGLVDELHLFVYPLTRGTGPRLFDTEAPDSRWERSACQAYDNGVVYLGYRSRRGGS